MNRKPNQSGKLPNDFETLRLIQSLGFEHRGGPYPSDYVTYSRDRIVKGVKTFDSITCGAYIIGGRAGTLEAKHAGYLAESTASGEGIRRLQELEISLEKIFELHADRLSELEAELKENFDIIYRD